MVQLRQRIENALHEIRILVLGLQILDGCGFRGFFEPGFEKMAPISWRASGGSALSSAAV